MIQETQHQRTYLLHNCSRCGGRSAYDMNTCKRKERLRKMSTWLHCVRVYCGTFRVFATSSFIFFTKSLWLGKEDFYSLGVFHHSIHYKLYILNLVIGNVKVSSLTAPTNCIIQRHWESFIHDPRSKRMNISNSYIYNIVVCC